jgi:hypothetical protein
MSCIASYFCSTGHLLSQFGSSDVDVTELLLHCFSCAAFACVRWCGLRSVDPVLVTCTGVIHVFTDGEIVHGLASVQGTTENAVCNNRGLCDTAAGVCHCFPLWTSGDGRRQGGPGAEADCGYRMQDLIKTNF